MLTWLSSIYSFTQSPSFSFHSYPHRTPLPHTRWWFK